MKVCFELPIVPLDIGQFSYPETGGCVTIPTSDQCRRIEDCKELRVKDSKES